MSDSIWKTKKQEHFIDRIKKDSMKQNDVDINAIMREFDQYVQVSLQNKSSQEEPENSANQLDHYYQTMQKRLKIKTISQDQKFQKILGPMKKLKSFVSIKEFLRGLNQKPIKTQNQPNLMSQNTKRKLQYEDLRGGLYMEKVQNHLKRNHLKRKLDQQAEFLLKELEEKQTQKNQYRTWMENVLGKINMKEECFIKPIEKVDTVIDQKINPKQFILTELTNTDIKKAKRENYKRRMSQEKQQKNFKKVSNFLAERLKKILTDKYVNNSSKQNKKNKEMMIEFNYDDSFKMVTQPSINPITYRRVQCKTTATSKRMRESSQMGVLTIRAQTTELKNRKGSDDVWKNKMHTKMENFMSVTNDYYQKCQEEKKDYRKLVNPYSDLAKDENQN